MSVSVSVCVITKKWVPLISVVLFTLSDCKHQRENSLTLNVALTVSRPLQWVNVFVFTLRCIPLFNVDGLLVMSQMHVLIVNKHMHDTMSNLYKSIHASIGNLSPCMSIVNVTLVLYVSTCEIYVMTSTCANNVTFVCSS